MESLEEDLQAQLEPPRDIALAAGMPKVGVPWRSIRFSWQPVGVHGTEESTVEDVASIGLEPHVTPLAEVGVLIYRKVLVEVLEPADIFILSGSIPKRQRAWVRPSRLIKVAVRSGILERSRQSAPDLIRELIVVEEEPAKVVIGCDLKRSSRLISLCCRDLPIADNLVHKSR